MLTTKRGEPLAVNAALNKQRTKLGLDLQTWLSIAFLSAVVFLFGYRFLAMIAFALMTGGVWLITRKHPKIFQLWFLRWQQKAYYDPRKR